MTPTISIITPTLNAASTLGETLLSAVPDDARLVEHLLIDALSSDGTLDVAGKFSGLNIFSEMDQGIYDGMNKGAKRASGEWLLFLQADDWLPDGALAAYQNAILSNGSADIICGCAEALEQRADGSSRLVWAISEPSQQKLTVENISLGEPMINARLIRREAFWRLDGFSLEYSLASDRDFLLRAAELGISQVEIPYLTYRYRWHEGSSTMTEGNGLTERLSQENLLIVKKHLRNAGELDRKSLRRWHDSLTVQLAMNALETFRVRDLLSVVYEGCRMNSAWPLLFFAEVLSSLPGYLSRGGRTRSQVRKEKLDKRGEL